jgi:hypothetical protein
MDKRIATAAMVLTALLCGDAYSQVTFTLIPPTGAVQGAPTQTVGWGFVIANNTPNYLVVDASDFCGLGGNPLFTDCSTPYNPPFQFGPSLGTYTDFIATNFTIIPPNSTVTQNFDAAAMMGVGAYMISPTAPPGATDPGNVFISFFTCSGNPLVDCGTASGDMQLFAPASVKVTTFITPTGASQVNYAANLNAGDSFVNITNTDDKNLCVNVYTFDPSEELVSCCSCMVTPNGLQSLSVRNDLLSNTLTSQVPTSVTISLVATNLAGPACNAATPVLSSLAAGLQAWDTTLHNAGSPSTYGMTENAFLPAALTPAGLARLNVECGFVQTLGSGFGICKSCSNSGLGASRK